MTNDVTGSNRTPTDVNQWELRTQILEQFSLEDLKKLCFRIDARLRQEGSSVRVDLDRVEGKTLEGKIVGLIQYLDLRGKLGYLADAVRAPLPRRSNSKADAYCSITSKGTCRNASQARG